MIQRRLALPLRVRRTFSRRCFCLIGTSDASIVLEYVQQPSRKQLGEDPPSAALYRWQRS